MKEKSIQKEDGYTSIANDLLDQLCRIRIPGEARQVLDVIFRQTYGWNKKVDTISLSQFSEKTGLRKPNIVRAIRQLLDMRLIIRNDNDEGSAYGPNKHCNQWVRVPKQTKRGRADGVVNRQQTDLIDPPIIQTDNDGLSEAITTPIIISDNNSLSEAITPVIRSDNKPLSEAIPTKDYMKDTLTKTSKPSVTDAVGPESMHRLVTSYFFDEYKRRFGVAYPHAGGKDGSTVKRIVGWASAGGISAEQVRACIDAFFDTDDEWVQTKGGFTLSVLWLQLPKIAPRILGNQKGKASGADKQTLKTSGIGGRNSAGGIGAPPGKYDNIAARRSRTEAAAANGCVGVAESPEGEKSG